MTNKICNEKGETECFDHTESRRLEQLLFSGKITFEEFCEAVDRA